MARSLGWRPDRYNHPNCEVCRIMPAVVNGLCVQCDYDRWLAQQVEQQRMDAQEAAELRAWASGR